MANVREVRWSATEEGWNRRKTILGAVATVGVAVVALAESLGQRWLAVSGLLAGLLIGVAGAAVGKAKSRREARREAAEWARLFRVQAAPVAWRRSTRKLIGVDAAPPTALGEEMPDYVPRGVDDKLRAAVEAALATDDGGAWLVVVSGPSKVGKSRSLR